MEPCNYFGKGRLSYLSFYLPPTLARVCLLFTNGIYGTLRVYSTPLRRVKVEKTMTRVSVKVQKRKKRKKGGKEGKEGKEEKTERNETWYGRNLFSYLVQLLVPRSILFLYCCCYDSDKARQSLLASTVASFNSSCQTLLGHAVAPAHYILLARGQRNIDRTAAVSPESARKYHGCQRVGKEMEKNLRCTEPRSVRPRIRKPELKWKGKREKRENVFPLSSSLLSFLPLAWEKGRIKATKSKIG